MSNKNKQPYRLVVIPSDPIEVYEQKGRGNTLQDYYNPMGMFSEVFAISPLEKNTRQAYGMTIIGCQKQDFTSLLRKISPNVIRAYGGFWTADLACRYSPSDIPVVVSVHDARPKLLHESVKYADLVICTSSIVAQLVTKHGTHPERVRLLPNRIDHTIFSRVDDKTQFQRVAEQLPEGKYILHVGRKSPEKNIETLVKALIHLPINYHCIFVGPGDNSDYLRLANQLNVCSRCFWIDSINNTDLPIWYSWCDCMCTPSLSEGFGIVFIEAAACGAAIVTSNIPPMNEYLVHGESAHLVNSYQNPIAVADAIRLVCEDGEYYQKLSTNAQLAALPFEKGRIESIETSIYLEAINLNSRSLTRQLAKSLWIINQSPVMSMVTTQKRAVIDSTKNYVRNKHPNAKSYLRKIFRRSS